MFAQLPPGFDSAMKEAVEAASRRGYEAIMLVLLLCVFMVIFAWVGKWFLNAMDRRLLESAEREKLLMERNRELARYIEEKLTSLIEATNKALVANTECSRVLTDTLTKRLCLLDPNQTNNMIDRLLEKFSEHLEECPMKAHGKQA